MKLISGKVLASSIYEKILLEIDILKIRPILGIIQVGNDQRSKKYVSLKMKKLTELNWQYIYKQVDQSISEEMLKHEIDDLQQKCTGIIVQLPLPKHINLEVLDTIHPHKDVDGLTLINQGMLSKGYDIEKYIIPCTPLGCMHFLEKHGIELKGSHVAVFGRSNLVGKPIATLLQNAGASVVILNQHDKNQALLSQNCDILISAIGSPYYINHNYVKKNAFIVDIGISEVNGDLLGDVHPSAYSKTDNISPTIDGIGPLTVAFLMQNLLKCYKLCKL